MTDVSVLEKSFFEKLKVYYSKNPGRCCDVTFLVGAQKEIVKTSRIILEIVCPVFITLFDQNWGEAVSRDNNEENGIPLPHVDPQVFKLFLNLLITDDVSVEALEKLNLAASELLSVTELCLDYKMMGIHQNLQVLTQRVLFDNNFSAYLSKPEFLTLSQSNLKTLLSNDELILENEAEIVDAALKWSEFQCSEKKIERTGENIRQVLGDALFQLPFSSMTLNDFSENTGLQDVLTETEQNQIFRYLCLSDYKKTLYDSGSFAFRIRKGCSKNSKKNNDNFSTLPLLEAFTIEKNPPFVCDGNLTLKSVLGSNEKVALHGVGFLGPIDCDSVYDVTVEIFDDYNTKSLGKLETLILTKRNERFYALFHQPVILESKNIQDSWNSYGHVHVHISLKGANLPVPVLGSAWKEFQTEADGVGFQCRVYDFPLAEYLFKKLS